MNHDIPAARNFLTMQPDNFAESSPNSIASHCVSSCFLDAPTETAELQAIRPQKNSEFSGRPAPPFRVNRVVIRAAK